MKHSLNRKVRRGFTLSEMLVVLGLLVAVTALSQPVLSGSLQDSRLRSAGKLVRVELAKARLKAMKTGIAQQFRHELGSNKFETAPLTLGGPGAQDSSGLTPGEDRRAAEGEEPAPGEEVEHFTLPPGVSFDDREEGAEETITSEDGWSDPIVFHPSGQTGSAQLRLKGERNSYVEISLRGLTGVATAGKLRHEEEQMR